MTADEFVTECRVKLYIDPVGENLHLFSSETRSVVINTNNIFFLREISDLFHPNRTYNVFLYDYENEIIKYQVTRSSIKFNGCIHVCTFEDKPREMRISLSQLSPDSYYIFRG